MRHLLAHPFQFGPWWLTLTIALLGLLVAVEFAYIRWAFLTDAKRDQRALEITEAKYDRRTEDFYWQHLGAYESAIALTLTMQRALEQFPDRVLHLIDGRVDTIKLTVAS